MSKGYGFEINDFLIAGAVLGAGYLLYKSVFKPLSDVTGSIATNTDKTLTATGDAISGNIDLLNIKKDVSSIFAFLNQLPPTQIGYTQDQVDSLIISSEIFKSNQEISQFLSDQNLRLFIERQRLDPNSSTYIGPSGNSGSGSGSGSKSLTGDSFLYNNYTPINTTDPTQSNYNTLPGN